MAIPTSRTKDAAIVTIDEELCSGCGKCETVCKDFGFEIIDEKAHRTGDPVFGCMACGHCVAICPEDAITINGRFLTGNDFFTLPSKETTASFDAIMNLFNRRRSLREFKNIPVEPDVIKKILEAAQSAPMGIPPTDVNVMVLDSKEKVRAFAEDFCRFLEKIKWISSPWFLAMMRPLWGKEAVELFRSFMRPLINKYISFMKKGINIVNYDAPVAMYFYGSPYCDPADPIIAATYCMIAAESLGLGTCMLGAIHPFIQSGSPARKFREKYGIRFKSREGLIVIMGYPAVDYRKGIRRGFASVN